MTPNTITGWELGKYKISRTHYPDIDELLGYLPNEIILTEISRPILRYRKRNHLSVKKLAKQINVDVTTLMKAENGIMQFQKSTLRRIQEFIRKETR